jgi:hypothetical protein
MLNLPRKLVLAASLGTGIASFASVASALPVLDASAIRNAAPQTIEQVQWRGGWGWGGPFALGAVAGALIGGALVGPYYYGYGPYYPGPYYPGPPPGYYGYPPPPPYGYPPPAPGYAAPPGASAGDPVAYCTQRYRSYSPQTGTYLGTDGQRHHCP